MRSALESSASPDDGLLLPYQRRWYAVDAPLAIIEKSRRIGITWADAADAVLTAAHRRGQNVWYTSYNLDQGKEYLSACAEWAKTFNHACSQIEEDVLLDEDRDVRTYRVTLASGRRITAIPPHAVRGKQGRVVIDEAAFLQSLDEALKGALAMLVWGGSVRVISTHNGDDSPFNDLIGEVRAGKRRGVVQRVTIGEALADGLYRRICEVTGQVWSPDAERQWLQDLVDTYGDAADEELWCVPARGAGRYLPRVLVERAMDFDIPIVEWRPPERLVFASEGQRRAQTEAWIAEHLRPVLTAARDARPRLRAYLGYDPARSRDPAVIGAYAETDQLGLDGIVQVELRDVPFSEQERIFDAIMTVLRATAAIDNRGAGMQLAEAAAQRHGAARVHQVAVSRQWYLEAFPRYRSLLEDDLLRLPRDARVLDDHAVVKTDRGVPLIAERTASAAGQRHGESAMVGALASWAQGQDGSHRQPASYRSVEVSGGSRWLGRPRDDRPWKRRGT